MAYKTLKLSALLADPSDNPRVDYSALPGIQKKIEEQGFDDSFPIQVVKLKERGPNGETHRVTGGFTRHKAASNLKLEEVPCVINDYSPEQVLRNHLTSNSGNPLTQAEQGKVFVQLRDYGTDPAKLEKGEEVREKPRTLAEIAQFTGYSSEHVRNCITIAESPEVIRELLETGKVSANAIIDASKGVKEPKTIRKILDAAVEFAGGVQATNKHVKEVKDRFVEPKKLKGKTEREANSVSADAAVGRSRDSGDTESKSEGKLKPLSGQENPRTENPNEESGAIPDADTSSKDQPSLIEPKSPKRDQLVCLITAWDDKRDVGCSDEDIEALADVLVDVF